MNSLEKQLLRNNEQTVKGSDSIVDDAKLLLSSNAAEEINTLNSIGLNQELRFVQEVKQDLIIRQSSKEKLEREIVHFDDIKRLCLDYRLYMRPAKEYMGTIPPDLGSELTRFCKEKNITLPAHADHSKFFIIAPPKMFKDYMSPGRVVTRAAEISIERERERIRKKNEDPILVYETEPNYYAVVKSWGNDFTPLRRIYGFFTRRATMKLVNFITKIVLIYAVFKLTALHFKYFLSLSNAVKTDDGWMLLSLLIFLISSIALCLWLWGPPFMDFRKEIIRIVTRRNEPVDD